MTASSYTPAPVSAGALVHPLYWPGDCCLDAHPPLASDPQPGAGFRYASRVLDLGSDAPCCCCSFASALVPRVRPSRTHCLHLCLLRQVVELCALLRPGPCSRFTDLSQALSQPPLPFLPAYNPFPRCWSLSQGGADPWDWLPCTSRAWQAPPPAIRDTSLQWCHGPTGLGSQAAPRSNRRSCSQFSIIGGIC